jgi:hypothetical protein
MRSEKGLIHVDSWKSGPYKPPVKRFCLVIILVPMLGCGCAHQQTLIPPGKDPDAIAAAINRNMQGIETAGSVQPPETEQNALTKCVLIAGAVGLVCATLPLWGPLFILEHTHGMSH